MSSIRALLKSASRINFREPFVPAGAAVQLSMTSISISLSKWAFFTIPQRCGAFRYMKLNRPVRPIGKPPVDDFVANATQKDGIPIEWLIHRKSNRYYYCRACQTQLNWYQVESHAKLSTHAVAANKMQMIDDLAHDMWGRHRRTNSATNDRRISQLLTGNDTEIFRSSLGVPKIFRSIKFKATAKRLRK